MRFGKASVLAKSWVMFLAVLFAAPSGGTAADAPTDERTQACQAAGSWLDPASGESLDAGQLMLSLAGQEIVLLGEFHTAAEHHRWQLHMLAGLQALRPELVVGFEMFPRAVQPALDRWARGQSSEAEFLEAARWHEVWGYDAELYLPLFHFVRQKRLPMVALNVDRGLISRVGREGWRAVPQEAREGLSDPAPASQAYRRSLAQVFQAKLQRAAAHQDSEEAPDLAAILGRDDFGRFVEAQSTWDRAMAEALATARADNPDALVVGVLGRGHIDRGHGVPHQLADLGQTEVSILVPVETGSACQALEADVADAAFLLGPDDQATEEPAKPRLGVMIEAADGGIRVMDVIAGSVAEQAGLLVGDLITTAAALPVARPAELVEIIQRQAPGTWLPLDVRRDSQDRQLVAKFPSSFE